MCQMSKLAVCERASTDDYTTWSFVMNWLIICPQARAAATEHKVRTKYSHGNMWPSLWLETSWFKNAKRHSLKWTQPENRTSCMEVMVTTYCRFKP